MRLSLKALAMAFGVLWGGCVLAVGIANLASPSYGTDFLRVMRSVYPGVHASRTVADVLIGTCYGLVDGGLAGLLMGWLYNLFSERGNGGKRIQELEQ